jgi:hypothetical protein
LQIIIEVPIRELQQYAGLANAGVTNQQYFEHMIEVVIHFQIPRIIQPMRPDK